MTLSRNSPASAVSVGGIVATYMANTVSASPASPITSAAGRARARSDARRRRLLEPHHQKQMKR